MKYVWVVTQSYNDYDQHGDYIEMVFSEKPTKELLMEKFQLSEKDAIHLWNGGGRKNIENSWYYLTQIEFGKQYKHSN